MNYRTAREAFEHGSKLIVDKQFDDALIALDFAGQLEPRQSAIPANVGLIYAEMGRTQEARDAYSQAIKIERQVYAPYEIRRALVQPVIQESNKSIDDERARLTKAIRELSKKRLRLKDPQLEIGNPSFFLAYQGRNNRDLQSLISKFFMQACPQLVMRGAHVGKKANGRLRLGIFSAHFLEHTVGRVNLGLVKELPKSLFEVVVIRPKATGDHVTAMIESCAESVLQVTPHWIKAREEIADLQLDILLFADVGLEPLSYFLGFSKLATIQCALWGHPNTTGIPSLDYFISSKTFEPENPQDGYSEELILLDRQYVCLERPVESEDLPRSFFGLPENTRIYLCPQSLFKIHPETDAVFRKILQLDSNACICLCKGPFLHWEERLRKRFARTCPDVDDRILFVPRTAPAHFCSLLRTSDVLIDPINFTGGYTSYLAFSQGAPVVTKPANSLSSRMTAGLYSQMGHTNLVAQSTDDFARIAVRVANDEVFRREQVQALREKSITLFNDAESIHVLGDFLAAAHSSKT